MTSLPPPVARRLRRLRRFWQLSLRKAWADNLGVQSAALAFLTLLSLVPLLAAFSHFGARFFVEQPELIVLLAQVLPYTETSINAVLGQFLDATGSLTGLGFATFLITALTAFSSIERVINEIWDVPKARSARSRIFAFLVILCAGPVLIAGGYSLVYLLERKAFPGAQLLAALLPFLLATTALTLLNWQVPNAAVKFSNALAAGLVAAVLLEALRLTFHFYVESFPSISVVYGTFGVAMLFMVSFQLAWYIVLLGIEVAYCLQNWELLTRHRDHVGLRGDWLGLYTMVRVVDRFKQGEPMNSPGWLSAQLGMPTDQLRWVLTPLEAAGFVREAADDDGGWMLARDPHEVKVADVLGAYEEPFPESIADLQPLAAERLLAFRQRLLASRLATVGGLKLAELVPSATGPETATWDYPAGARAAPASRTAAAAEAAAEGAAVATVVAEDRKLPERVDIASLPEGAPGKVPAPKPAPPAAGSPAKESP